MTCPHCGRQIPDTAKVCGYCGTRLVGQEATSDRSPPPQPAPVSTPSPSPPAQTSRRRRWLIPLVLVLVLVVAGILVIVNLDRESDDLAAEPEATTTSVPSTTVTTTAQTTTTVPPTAAPTTTSTNPTADLPGFVGGWAATDLDGSAMWLWIDITDDLNRYSIVVYDEGASTCDPDLTVTARLDAGGTAGDAFTFEVDEASFVCLHPDGDVSLEPIVVAYAYNPTDDTLTSSLSDVIWIRTEISKESILGS